MSRPRPRPRPQNFVLELSSRSRPVLEDPIPAPQSKYWGDASPCPIEIDAPAQNCNTLSEKFRQKWAFGLINVFLWCSLKMWTEVHDFHCPQQNIANSCCQISEDKSLWSDYKRCYVALQLERGRNKHELRTAEKRRSVVSEITLYIPSL